MVRLLFKMGMFLMALLLSQQATHVKAEAVHHNLQIALLPQEHKLVGTDEITIDGGLPSPFSVLLSKKAKVSEVSFDGKALAFTFEDGLIRLSGKWNGEGVSRLRIEYVALFDDPVPRMPANTDNPGYGVNGTVSEEGAFLQAGAGWYPSIQGALATYEIVIVAPAGMLAVTSGRSLGHETKDGKTFSRWDVEHAVEGLSLSAGRYVVHEQAVGRVRAATYFFPEDDHLSTAYLDATAHYLELYDRLFGEYPFEKFAVVENVFPTGYGFPSYTLMGKTVLRLPFIVHTSLGHEIAHSWWGNGVYVDDTEGNWCEGLTTYVSDYLYKEMASPQAARQYRLQILRDYATLVSPEDDFPLSRFESRYDPVSKTIGYGKGAMVFHMVRQLLGEEAFWGALRDVYAEKRFQKASWDDFRKAFESRGNRSLKRFFEEWVFRKGAPRLSLDRVKATQSGGVRKVEGRIAQEQPFYDLRIPLSLKTRSGTVIRDVDVRGEGTPFEIPCDTAPRTLSVDPGFDVFRRLWPSEVPPSINSVKASPGLLVIVADHSPPDLVNAARTIILSLGVEKAKIVREKGLREEGERESDLLLVGLPQRKDLISKAPQTLSLQGKDFVLGETRYARPSDTFFGVFPHPFTHGRVEALFFPLSGRYGEVVARKVTHYGAYSYLVFEGDENRVKGFWPVSESPLVYRWGAAD
jgi:hypothetical protein